MHSHLEKDLRHLVHVLAVSAKSDTGVGWLSQSELAERMGCTDRHVRKLLAELERPDASPVRVERRPRFKSGGRGRTSDEWRLVLVEDASNRNHVPPEAPTNRHVVPVEGARLTGTPRRTNRNATTDQPERCSAPLDLRSDLRSDLRGESTRTRQRASWLRVPADWQPNEQHRELARSVGADFDLELAKYRDHDYKHPKRDPDAAFRNWLRGCRRLDGNGRAAAHRGPAPVSTTFDPADDFGGLT